MGSVSKYTVQPNGYDDRFQFWRSSDYNPKGNLWHCSHTYSNHAHTFGWCKYTYFAHKNYKYACQFLLPQHNTNTRTHKLCITWHTVVPLHYPCVDYLTGDSNFWYVHRRLIDSDYWSNFAKTVLFENCSCFSKIPFSISVESLRIFQCLISIPAGHWVWQIDSDLPRWSFLSTLLSLVIIMTGRSERSARAMRDGADVVCETIGN